MDLVTFDTLLLLVSFILFLIVAFGNLIPKVANKLQSHVNLVALGLALWVLVFLIDSWNRM